MKETKRKKLEAAGWRVGSADEFLGLSAVESVLVELRLALSQALRQRRARLHISQRTLAERIESSQSRIAKMEAADPDVSFELLLRGLLATGATRRDVGSVLGAASTTKRKPGRRSVLPARRAERLTAAGSTPPGSHRRRARRAGRRAGARPSAPRRPAPGSRGPWRSA